MYDISLVSFNILSNRSSHFNRPELGVEKPEEYTERFNLIITEIQTLLDQNVDIICLQEITPEFITLITNFFKNNIYDYWFVNNFKQAIIINIQNYSYRPLMNSLNNLNKYSQIQTLLIHRHHPETSFYLANIHLTGEQDNSSDDIRRNLLQETTLFFNQYSQLTNDRLPNGVPKINRPILIVGDYNTSYDNITNNSFKEFMTNNKLELNYPKYPTSYHRYEYIRLENGELKYDHSKSDKDSYQTIDLLINSKSIKVDSITMIPKKGLTNLEVPYTHKIKNKKVINESNYNVWMSDHALITYHLSLHSM